MEGRHLLAGQLQVPVARGLEAAVTHAAMVQAAALPVLPLALPVAAHSEPLGSAPAGAETVLKRRDSVCKAPWCSCEGCSVCTHGPLAEMGDTAGKTPGSHSWDPQPPSWMQAVPGRGLGSALGREGVHWVGEWGTLSRKWGCTGQGGGTLGREYSALGRELECSGRECGALSRVGWECSGQGTWGQWAGDLGCSGQGAQGGGSEGRPLLADALGQGGLAAEAGSLLHTLLPSCPRLLEADALQVGWVLGPLRAGGGGGWGCCVEPKV